MDYGAGDETAASDGSAADREDELNAARIRQISVLRRGLYRTRSHVVAGAVALLVAAGELLRAAVVRFQAGDRGPMPAGYALAALAGLIGCAMLARQTAAINRELRQTAQRDPAAEPDFSTLSDGSQQWKNLERLNAGGEPPDGHDPHAVTSPPPSLPRE